MSKGEDAFSLVLPDGREQVINYKNSRSEGPKDALGCYTIGATKDGLNLGEGHQMYHHFCKSCGIHPFIIGRQDQFMGGPFAGINLNCVDNWEELGVDLKDVTEIGKMTYVNGAADFTPKKGEPWAKQAW